MVETRLEAGRDWFGRRKRKLTFAFVGIPGGGPCPGSIEVERPTSLAVSAGCVVPALAGDLAVLALDAPRRVAVALAPAADGKVGDGVVMGERARPEAGCCEGAARRGGHGDGRESGPSAPALLHRVVRLHLLGGDHLVHRGQSGGQGVERAPALLALQPLLPLPLAFRQLLEAEAVLVAAAQLQHLLLGRLLGHVQAVEHDADVGRRHPVLQHRRVVEVGGRRPALERAERDPADGREPVAARVPMAVRAPRLLLVRLRDGGPVRPPVDAAALGRVELERLPGLAVVHRLVNRDRVRLGRLRAELQADVGQLVLLAQGEGQGHVVGRRGETLRRDERLAPPAGHVVGVAHVREVARGETAPRRAVVADVALTYAGATSRLLDHVAIPRGPAAPAGRGGLDRRAERRVHEIRYAPSRPVLVVARIRWVLLAGERFRVDLAPPQRVAAIDTHDHSANDPDEESRVPRSAPHLRPWCYFARRPILSPLFSLPFSLPALLPPFPLALPRLSSSLLTRTAPYCVTYAHKPSFFRPTIISSLRSSPDNGRTTRVAIPFDPLSNRELSILRFSAGRHLATRSILRFVQRVDAD